MGLLEITTPKETAIAGLALISFFYLLRVGEYTQKRHKSHTHTIQFRMCDIAFIPQDTLAEVIGTAILATLYLSNQKNGVQGGILHCSAEGVIFSCQRNSLALYSHA